MVDRDISGSRGLLKPLALLAVLAALLAVAIVLGTTLWGTTPAPAAATQTITICKVTFPPGGTGFPFNWTAGAAGPQPSFSLDDQQCTKLDVTPFGGYNFITEVVPSGWTLTNIACNNTTTPLSIVDIATHPNPNPGAMSPFAPGDDTVALDLNEANVTCTFTNRCSVGVACSTPTPTPIPTPTSTCDITIDKLTNPAGGTGFAFSSLFAGLQNITLGDGQSITKTVPCGTNLSVYETPTPGWTLTNIACAFTNTGLTGSFNIVPHNFSNSTPGFQPGDDAVGFSMFSGASLHCTFTNDKVEVPGSITICKATKPPGGSGFTFGWSSPLIHTIPFPLDDGQCVTHSGLLPSGGPYSFWELSPLPPGWTLANIVCTGGANVLIGSNSVFDPGDTGVTIHLGPGENVTCTFTNSSRPCLPGAPPLDISTGTGGIGVIDPIWTMTSAPTGVPLTPFGVLGDYGPWVTPTSPANWIDPNNTGGPPPGTFPPNDPAGTYVYETSFTVPPGVLSMTLDFKFAADNDVQFFLNNSLIPGTTVSNAFSAPLHGPIAVPLTNPFGPYMLKAVV